MTEPVFTTWRKSSRSGGGSNCVEVAISSHGDAVGVRDTKNRAAGILMFSSTRWAQFITAVQAGTFDLA